ncbi:MAG: S-layer homology domain-containing protein [Clostridiales bacterium]|nr:S-layer homology domain-containing protein [Clostridiales bacterium]
MNKNLKKAISAVAALALTATSIAAVSAQNTFSDVTSETPYGAAIKQLSAMGIVDGFDDGGFHPDENVTRAQFAKLVTATQNKLAQAEANTTVIFNDVPAEHWAVGYVAQAYQTGLVNGTNDEGTTFDPDMNVTYAQAMKMLVCAAGYENWSENQGGWPTGYLYYANQVGIGSGVTGVSNDTALTRGQVSQMIANTLTAAICKITGYSTDNGQQVADRKQMDGTNGNLFESLLTNEWDMYEVNGTVYGTHESGATDAGEVQYKIMKSKNYDGNEYKLTNAPATDKFDDLTGEASNTLNQYTRAILKLDDTNDTKSIVYIETAGKNVEVEFEANNYASLPNVGTDTAKIAIYKSASSSTTTEYKLSKTAKMIVNGVEIDLNTTNAEKFLDGNAKNVKATLVDSPACSNGSTDGYYDYVVVEYAATAVVDEVITKSSTKRVNFDTYDTYIGKAYLDIDENDDTKVYTFIKNGQEIKPEELAQNDVLSLVFKPNAEINSSDFVKATVTNNVVSGQCTATGKDTDGKEYFTVGGTNYYMSGAVKGDSLDISYDYELYLDANGDIAKYDQTAASVNYAILDKFYTSAGDTMVRLIDKTGEKKGYTLKEDQSKSATYTVKGETKTGKLSDVMAINMSYTDADFALENRIVDYSINSSGECTIKGTVDDGHIKNAVVNRSAATDTYTSSSQRVGSYKIAEGSIILNADAYATNTTDSVSVVGLDYFINEMEYEVIVAGKKNASDSSYPFVVIVKGNEGYTVDTRMAIFESAGSTQVDGENKDMMYVYVNGSNAEDSKGRTTVIAESGVVTAASLTEGDAIIYKTNSDGYVDNIIKVTKMSTNAIASQNRDALAYANTPAAKYSSSAMITDAAKNTNFKGDGEVSFVFGPVTDRSNSSVDIASVSKVGSVYTSNVSGKSYSYDGDKTKIYTYDGNGRSGNFIEVSTASGVIKSSISTTGYTDANKSTINWNNENNVIYYALIRCVDSDVKDVLSIQTYDKAGTTTADVVAPTPTPTSAPTPSEAPASEPAPVEDTTTDATDVVSGSWEA